MSEAQLDILKKSLGIADENISVVASSRQTQVSRATSQIDNLTSVSQRMSVNTNDTYISKLEKTLGEEQKARQQLQREVDDLKKTTAKLAKYLN